MKVEVKEAKQEPPPIEVVITLSVEEARCLRAVIGATKSSPFTSELYGLIKKF